MSACKLLGLQAAEDRVDEQCGSTASIGDAGIAAAIRSAWTARSRCDAVSTMLEQRSIAIRSTSASPSSARRTGPRPTASATNSGAGHPAQGRQGPAHRRTRDHLGGEAVRAMRRKGWRDSAPLCPAGHLPHKGGDWQRRHGRSSATWPIIQGLEIGRKAMTANLPPCGGDVRQDRGGQRRALTSPTAPCTWRHS